MPETVFSSFPTVKFAGPDSNDPLAYQFYDADRVVLGKPLREHLRFAVAYWHSLAMNGSDPFGGPTIQRPWSAPGDPIAQAKVKADAAFELFRVLDLPFFCFHDADIAPRRRNARRDPKELPYARRLPRRKNAELQDEAACGERPTSSHTRASWLALPPIPTPRSLPGVPRR